jgi:hypothetical protein
MKPGLNVLQVNTGVCSSNIVVWPTKDLFKKGLFSEPSLVQTDEAGDAAILMVNLSDKDVLTSISVPVGWTEQGCVASCPAFEVEWGANQSPEQPDWLRKFRLEETSLTPNQRVQVEDLLMRYQGAISVDNEDLGYCKGEECTIDTGMAAPVRLRWRRLSPLKQAAVDREVASLKKRGLIVDSTSPWAAPLVVVPKKSGELRVCTDDRGLNAVSKKDSYTMPDVCRWRRRIRRRPHLSPVPGCTNIK